LLYGALAGTGRVRNDTTGAAQHFRHETFLELSQTAIEVCTWR
jgi:hypothetical protein